MNCRPVIGRLPFFSVVTQQKRDLALRVVQSESACNKRDCSMWHVRIQVRRTYVLVLYSRVHLIRENNNTNNNKTGTDYID